MIDSYLQLSAEKMKKEAESSELERLLSGLPVEELSKIASGKVKLSDICLDGGSKSWLEPFKGTELFEQAVAIEQADIQNDIARQQSQVERPDSQQFYQVSDQLRLQKKMLELQLMTLQNQAPSLERLGVPPEPPNVAQQGAGAVGDVPVPEGSTTVPERVVTASAILYAGSPEEKFASADRMGRYLAQLDFEKRAFEQDFMERSGQAMLKIASTSDIATKALDFVKRNPRLVGGTFGAVGGGLAAPPGHRVSGALAGAGLGAGAGHVAGGIAKNMGKGQGFADAAGNFANKTWKGIVGKTPKVPSAAPALEAAT